MFFFFPRDISKSFSKQMKSNMTQQIVVRHRGKQLLEKKKKSNNPKPLSYLLGYLFHNQSRGKKGLGSQNIKLLHLWFCSFLLLWQKATGKPTVISFFS